MASENLHSKNINIKINSTQLFQNEIESINGSGSVKLQMNRQKIGFYVLIMQYREKIPGSSRQSCQVQDQPGQLSGYLQLEA